MRPAVVCPSVFHFPHAGGVPSAMGVSDFLDKWFAALQKHLFIVMFSPGYVRYLQQDWMPTLKSREADSFRKQPCWLLILRAADRYPFSSNTKVKGICSCTYANHSWVQQLNELNKQNPIIVSNNCRARPQGFDTVCSESELNECYPENWLKFFREIERQKVPLQGEIYYVPPKHWERTGIHIQTKQNKTGYPAHKNAIWSYDKTEDHWEVFPPNEHIRYRVTPEGKRLDTKQCQ